MSKTLTIYDLTFEVRRSARRKTLQVTLDRAGELIVTAPAGLAEATIDQFVREKRGWVYRKLAEKALLWQPHAKREFVTGEGFPYLGRSYRLKLVEDQDCPLKLLAGRFHLKRSEVAHGRDHFVQWYMAHARPWIEDRLPTWADRLGVTPKGIRVLDLGHRWASCSRSGLINIHWTLAQLPVSVVDYVLAHELAHLLEPTHGAEFWRLVERVMPDYTSRKNWLAEHGQVYVGI